MIVTTSRNPSIKTKQFARDLSKSLPLTSYSSRGKKALKKIFEEAEFKGKNLVLVIEEKKNKLKIQGINLSNNKFKYSFNFIVKPLKSRKELSKSSKKINSVKIKIQNPKILKLVSFLISNELNSFEEEFSLKEEKKVLSFFFKRKEIGPKFKVEEINLE